LAEIKADDGTSYRAFVTQTINPYSYPAKDRSGRLDLLEPPDLGALIAKCAGTGTPAQHPQAPINTPRFQGVIQMNDNNREANAWSDFNDAEAQQSGFNLIPKGALVPVLMTLKPGGAYSVSS
jgi:hypothetical protein